MIGEGLLILYYALAHQPMQNIIVTGMQVTSVFIPTAIAALLFPYMKRAKGVWDSSPYKTWRFLGLPVVVWGAVVDLIYLGILLYVFIFNKAAGAVHLAGRRHPVRRRLGAGRRLVLLLEAAQQGGGRRRVAHLRRAAA